MGKSLSSLKATNWNDPRDIAEFLRVSGYPDTPKIWSRLTGAGGGARLPDEEGTDIAAAGEEPSIDYVIKRVSFAKKFSGKRIRLKIDRKKSKAPSRETLIQAAISLDIPAEWYENGSLLYKTETLKNRGNYKHTEINEHEKIPHFAIHYYALRDAASFAQLLCYFYMHLLPSSQRVSNKSGNRSPEDTVRIACEIMREANNPPQSDDQFYKIRDKGELHSEWRRRHYRYFPFIHRMLLGLKKAEDAIYSGRAWNLQINSEERLLLMYSLQSLGSSLDVVSGSGLFLYTDELKKDKNAGRKILDLHHRIMILLGQAGPSPLGKHKSGRPPKDKGG